MRAEEYLMQLSVVKTTTLPRGALFVADIGKLYQVVDAGQHGEHKARLWRHGEHTEVALDGKSGLARRLPTVEHGRQIPPFTSRDDLMDNRRPLLYAFRREQTAMEAALIDVALCGERSGLYTRRNEQYPCFEVTNGSLLFRQYFFMETDQGNKTNLADLKHGLNFPLRPHLDGPAYWRLLPSWETNPVYDTSQTIAMRPIDTGSLPELPGWNDDTLPNQKKVE